LAIATEAPVIDQFLIKELTVFSTCAKLYPDELEFVSLTFSGTSFSSTTTLVSMAPGLKLTREARNVIINIFLVFDKGPF
jgi:hypothetical protein